MDLRAYYQQIRELESSIASAHVVVMSVATPDGGKAGVCTEVSRAAAAKMIVEQRARLATHEEVAAFRERFVEAAKRVETAQLANRVQIAILPEKEVHQLRERLTPRKD